MGTNERLQGPLRLSATNAQEWERCADLRLRSPGERAVRACAAFLDAAVSEYHPAEF